MFSSARLVTLNFKFNDIHNRGYTKKVILGGGGGGYHFSIKQNFEILMK